MESHVVGRFVKRALFHPLRLSAIASHGTHTQHHTLNTLTHKLLSLLLRRRRPLGLLSRPHPRRALPIGDEADRRRAVDH